MIIDNITAINAAPLYYRYNNFLDGVDVYIKLEGLNLTGSIKLKTALYIVEQYEKQGMIKDNTQLICSSSGNLAIAMSTVCKERGYSLICVSDPNISSLSERYIRLYDAELIKVTACDENGGYLNTRIKLIKEMCLHNPNLLWVNQYGNIDNINAHYESTAREIYSEFSNLNYLFIGAGTTGTLMGCAKFFKEHSPQTKIIAVDAVGSVTFSQKPKKRYIPGLGTSRRPEIADPSFLDDIIFVEEIDTARMCRALVKEKGLFLGGSSGTVLQGVYQYKDMIKKQDSVLMISPDFGNRYLNSIYDNDWVNEKL